MYLLKEYSTFEYDPEQVKKSKEKNSGKILLTGVLQRANTLNQNGRIYPMEILRRELENYQKFISENRALGECVDGETQILTKDGWKYIKNISENETIATLNLDTDQIEYQQIQEKVIKQHNGVMYHFVNKSGLDMMLTPKHKVVIWNRSIEPLKIEAQDVYKLHKLNSSWLNHSFIKSTGNWIGVAPETFTIPNTNFSMPIKTWAALFGIWLAEGHVAGSKNAKKHTNKIGITQKKPDVVKKIRELLSETGLAWKELSHYKDGKIQWILTDSNIHAYFKQFGNSLQKFIPQEFKTWNTDVLETMMSWMLLGDGRNRKNKKGELLREYCTTSPKLAEDVQEIFLKLGSYASINKRVQKTRILKVGRTIGKENQKPLYIVSENTSKTMMDARFISIQEIPFNEEVYCVRVPNNTWMMKRNGKMLWTSNCDHADSPVVELKHVSHIVREARFEGNVVVGTVELLDTPCGNIVKALVEAGVKVGISSRGVGSVVKEGNDNIVQDDFQLICWDFVSEPSTPGAFMLPEAVNESVLKKVFKRSDRIDRIANEIIGMKRNK